MIEGQKCIGLKFYQDKVMQGLVHELPGILWSDEFHMNCVPNSPTALDGIFEQFRGMAWVTFNHFFINSGFSRNNEDIKVDWVRKRPHPKSYRRCSESYLLKLEFKRYANNTKNCTVSTLYIYLYFVKYNIMQITTVSEFRKDIKTYLDRVVQNFETLIINRGKDSGIVVMSLQEYNSLMATNHELSSRKNELRLDSAIDKLKNGTTFNKDLIEN